MYTFSRLSTAHNFYGLQLCFGARTGQRSLAQAFITCTCGHYYNNTVPCSNMQASRNILEYCSVSIIIETVTACIVTIFVIKFLLRRNQFTREINKIPGPKGNFILGNAMLFAGKLTGCMDNIVTLLQTQYRKEGIIRIWMGPEPFVVIFNADMAQALLTNWKHTKKSKVYDFLIPGLGNGLVTSNGNRWHFHRKLLTSAFHFRILEDFMPLINQQCDILVQSLLDETKQGKKLVDIYNNLTLCTLDIICVTAMGCAVNAQLHRDSEYVQSVCHLSHLAFKRMITPWLYPNAIFNFSKLASKLRKCLEVQQGFALKVLNDKKSSNQQKNAESEPSEKEVKRLAFLDLLIEASDNYKLLSDADIKDEVNTFIAAGHDSTACTTFWALYFLGLNPDCLAKAQAEMDAILGDGEQKITFENLKQMKYIERVIKETLRLCPAAPVIARALTEDLHAGKYTVPAGVNCVLVLFSLHRDPEQFPRPEKFDPDRFLPENFQTRHKFAYLPFSAGPRNCIAQKYAMATAKVILGSILKNFNVTTLYKGRFRAVAEIALRPPRDLKLQLEKRGHEV